ncbi:AraC family transcriptional regulator [Neorhodopirellula pilleata]|uniref:HTH-type transcriptional activator RhaS n=1 Tax=Neorhodopirellula pilleata TaxID=2714738 RepID=A0A5C5ZZW8_9BACT|nr:AraC family transcriptional regulator [Neorhodopirellula pilleata]TWT92571.1 HTH-type transcriptional activator RhaS [Neorhodopirellula pilleata]
MTLYKSRMDMQEICSKWFESLDDASELLRLFDFLPGVFLYVKDDSGRFVAMNAALAHLSGAADPQECLGKTDVDLHSAYWGRRYQEEDREVMQSGVERPHQVWLVPTGRGRLGTFVSSKIPLRGKAGTVIGIAGVMIRLDQDLETNDPSDPVDQATRRMTERYADAMEIARIAEEVGLSVSQLNRRFRAKHQIPPSEYLQRVRVYQASRLLVETQTTIGDVALQCGFYDQAHLNRTFRKWMQMTPSEFRRLERTISSSEGTVRK